MKANITIGEKYDPAMKITDPAEAARYFGECVENTMGHGHSWEEAARIERQNLGYYAGYYNNETRERVERLFGCAHPIFGAIAEDGPPTAEEALAAGRLAAEATCDELRKVISTEELEALYESVLSDNGRMAVEMKSLADENAELEAQVAAQRGALELTRDAIPMGFPGEDVSQATMVGRAAALQAIAADLPAASSELLLDRQRVDGLIQLAWKRKGLHLVFLHAEEREDSYWYIDDPETSDFKRPLRTTIDVAMAAEEDSDG